MTPEHLPQVKQIIELNQMFPAELLDDMDTPFFGENSEEFWRVIATPQSEILAVAYCAPEYMTENSWNLLLMAVHPEFQGKGMGAELMSCMESEVKNRQGRILLVETSGLPDYGQTREFYPKCGYKEVARIPEYYAAGDDKVVFWKKLTG
jgi:ribosomal protein S18 acetylase RimI-like enzyme